MKTRWLAFTAAALAVGVAAAGEPAKPKGPLACGPGGLDVTVALAYDPNTGGPIAATLMDVGFGPPLALPATPQELRRRVTSLLPPATAVRPLSADGGRLRVALTTTEQGIQPAKAFRLRFDCTAGAPIDRDKLSCSTSEVVGASGQPLDDAIAHEVRCQVDALDPVKR
jgi:hypothetical protein